jgi:hypothetical protein
VDHPRVSTEVFSGLSYSRLVRTRFTLTGRNLRRSEYALQTTDRIRRMLANLEVPYPLLWYPHEIITPTLSGIKENPQRHHRVR